MNERGRERECGGEREVGRERVGARERDLSGADEDEVSTAMLQLCSSCASDVCEVETETEPFTLGSHTQPVVYKQPEHTHPDGQINCKLNPG